MVPFRVLHKNPQHYKHRFSVIVMGCDLNFCCCRIKVLFVVEFLYMLRVVVRLMRGFVFIKTCF